ncbi:hypothetical protein ABZ404_37125 [Streptomyces sp. NPDC005878]|uniref:hypothetical protein n=1 Tax=Streptomyces sp. NPDC005878 TaxID=3157077 RepID=UPI0033FAABA8
MATDTSPEALTLAYLAGVIDSDGFISINRSTRKGRLYFGAVIGISGTRPQPHELAASLWGGQIYCYQPKNPRHRAQYQWSRQGEGAVAAILAIQPYLRIKQEQARIALEAQEHISEGRCEDPYPWFGPDYDPNVLLNELRDEMVFVLNQGRRITSRTWDQFPAVPS